MDCLHLFLFSCFRTGIWSLFRTWSGPYPSWVCIPFMSAPCFQASEKQKQIEIHLLMTNALYSRSAYFLKLIWLFVAFPKIHFLMHTNKSRVIESSHFYSYLYPFDLFSPNNIFFTSRLMMVSLHNFNHFIIRGFPSGSFFLLLLLSITQRFGC